MHHNATRFGLAFERPDDHDGGGALWQVIAVVCRVTELLDALAYHLHTATLKEARGMVGRLAIGKDSNNQSRHTLLLSWQRQSISDVIL
jgi:hypothetical protein